MVKNKKGGSILLLSSVGGYQCGNGAGAYAISKAAILGMTRVLSQELEPKGIRVNCLAPG